MKKIEGSELDKICGGTTISSAVINAFTNIIKVLMDAGRSVGSSIRRITSDGLCPLE